MSVSLVESSTAAAVVCVVYLSQIGGVAERARQALGPALAGLTQHVFEDTAYGRSSVTLAGGPACVSAAAARLVRELAASRSLRQHAAQHPRVGVVDNIVLSPAELGELASAAAVAARLAERVAADNDWARCVLYGPTGGALPTLAQLRRQTPYFSPSALAGPLAYDRTAELEGLRSFGLSRACPDKGLTFIGAVPWVVNYNVPLLPGADLALARRVAAALRARAGPQGLPHVEAVGLAHRDGLVEVACNLLDTTVTGPEQVQRRVEELAGPGRTAAGYVIGLPWAPLAARARAAMAVAQLQDGLIRRQADQVEHHPPARPTRPDATPGT
jgi:glutamate formiminotransferase